MDMNEAGNKLETDDKRFDFYLKMVERFFDQQPKTFKELVTDLEAKRAGDQLLSNGMSTGYNFAPQETFPLEDRNILIFHNNYIQRPRHFAKLLAEIEKANICSEKEVSLGLKGSKVIGYWGDKEAVKDELTRNGKVLETSESVEGVAIFHPKTKLQALEIAGFLITRAVIGAQPFEIDGSWFIPDIRVSNHPWSKKLISISFAPVVANIRRFRSGNIIALKTSSNIPGKDWKSFPILVNERLKDFLSDDVVTP